MVSQFQQANQLQRSGKLEEAVIAYRSAIASNPDFYWSYHNLGETLTQLGRLDEAVEAYHAAVELNPSAACSHLNLAEVLEKQGKEEEAIACYQRAVELNPQFQQAYESLKKLFNRQPNEKEINRVFQQANKLNQKSILVQENRTVELANKDNMLSTEISRSQFSKVRQDLGNKIKISQQNYSQNNIISVQVLIPSFNRNHLLRNLIKRLNEEAVGFQVTVSIFDDGSREPVLENSSNYPNLTNLSVHRYNNHGKKRYWQLVNHIFDYIRKQNVDIFIYLADDLDLAQGFFHKAINQWLAITDPDKVALNLALDQRKDCWTGFKRIKRKYDDIEVFQTQWVDMIMLFDQKLLGALDYRIQPVSLSRWKSNPNLSSGVGRQISLRLNEAGFSLYQVTSSLIAHDDHDSMMNPEERKNNPIVIKIEDQYPDEVYKENQQPHIEKVKFSEKISKALTVSVSDRRKYNSRLEASLASIPERVNSLKLTIESLYPQVDQINVYLNNYKSIPEFLLRDKIRVVCSQLHGDLGDSGKFFWCEDIQGYHFTCDDDLTYPPDYVETLIAKIEEYERKVVVGVHGSILRQPFTSYRKARNIFHYLQKVDQDTFVHHLGTGTVAYHTSTIEVLRNEFEYINMGDIWFSLLAQKYKIPRIILKHPAKWLKQNEIDMKKTIYEMSEPETINSSLSTRKIQDYIIKQTQPWHINYLPNKPIVVMSLTTFNNKEYLQDFIGSWDKTKSDKYHWILIIVDNGSTDGTIDYLFSIRPFWQFTLIQKQGLSEAELVNTIFDECQNLHFDYGFYADNDVFFINSGWDQLYINAIEKSGYAHLCYQNIEYLRRLTDNQKSSQSIFYQYEQIDNSGYCSTRIAATHYIGLTKFFSFNKQTLKQVGYADPSQFASGKEWQVDFYKRLARAGFNDVNKYWDAKGSNEYLKIQGLKHDSDRLVAEYYQVYKSFLAKYRIIEDEQRIYVNALSEHHYSKSKNHEMNQYFDKIYLINLDSKINRWHQAKEWANKYGINLTRFVGVDGNAPQHKTAWEDYARKGLVKLPEDIKPIETTEEFYFNYKYDVARVAYIEQNSGKKGIPKPEKWGYLLSVIRVLEDAINNNYHRILVLEDDITPHHSIKSLFAQGIKEAPEDWKIILLGVFQDVWDRFVTPYSKHLYQSNGTNEGSFAMALDSSVFVPLLHYTKKFDLAFDVGALHKVQRKYKDKCFVFQPNIFSKN